MILPGICPLRIPHLCKQNIASMRPPNPSGTRESWVVTLLRNSALEFSRSQYSKTHIYLLQQLQKYLCCELLRRILYSYEFHRLRWILVPTTSKISLSIQLLYELPVITFIPTGLALVLITSIVWGKHSSDTKIVFAFFLFWLFCEKHKHCFCCGSTFIKRMVDCNVHRELNQSIIVWKFSKASVSSWDISAWYRCILWYQPRIFQEYFLKLQVCVIVG